MSAISKTTKEMAKASSVGLMVESMTELGRTENSMASEFTIERTTSNVANGLKVAKLGGSNETSALLEVVVESN